MNAALVLFMAAAMLLAARPTSHAETRNANPRCWQLEGRPRTFPRYVVDFKICLLACDDAPKANALANRLNAVPEDRGQDFPLPEGFRKTDRLVLRHHANSVNIPYAIDPPPIRTEAYPDTNEIHFFFDKRRLLGQIPYVSVRAQIEPACSVNPYEPLENRRYFLKETPAWPTGSSEVRDCLAQIPVNRANELTTLQSLLQGLRSGSGIEQGVEPKGERATRHGVRQTLEKKSGNCWDFSDLFVTLCRALDLPCRQVAGWQKTGGGHVWAEVYLTNIGWLQVNPTTGKTIGENHVPLFTTSDGNLSLIYRSFPVIREIEAEQAPAGDALKDAHQK